MTLAQTYAEKVRAEYEAAGRPGARSRPVFCDDGRRFDSCTAAARAVGTTSQSINRAAAHGWNAGGHRWSFNGRPEKPAAIIASDGRTYPSAKAAGNALGVHDQIIHRRIKDGRPIAGLQLKYGPNYGRGKGRWKRSRREERTLTWWSNSECWLIVSRRAERGPGYVASVKFNGATAANAPGFTVLGVYPDRPQAIAAAKHAIVLRGTSRLCTPADIDKARAER